MKIDQSKLLRTITACSIAANVIVLGVLGYMTAIEKQSDRDILASRAPVYIYVAKSPSNSNLNNSTHP